MREEKWHKKLLWLVIGAIVTVIITALFTPLIDNVKSGITNFHIDSTSYPSLGTMTNLPSFSPTPTLSLVQLKHSYNGTLVGGVHSPMDISFTLISQDNDGTITNTLMVQGGGDYYFHGPGSCQGTLNYRDTFISNVLMTLVLATRLSVILTKGTFCLTALLKDRPLSKGI